MTSFYEELRKNDSISDEKENAQSRATIDKWIFRILLFLIGVMPLIVLANVEEILSPLISNVDMLSSGMKGDLFTHYKSFLIIIVTVIITLMFLTKVFFMGGTIRKTPLNYVLGVFVLAIIVSAITSPNISIALNGQYNRSDGALSWLCYVALMFIAMNIEYPKNVIRYITYTMMPFVYINLFIITMNFYGKDLLQQAWLQKLVSIALPEGASIAANSELVGTLNQWNYMSGMFAIMTGMYLAWAVTSEKWSELVVGSITATATIAVVFMSISTSGFLTLVVTLPFILAIIFKLSSKKKGLIALIMFVVLSIIPLHILSEKNPRVWDESIGFFISINPYAEEVVDETARSNPDFRFELFKKVAASETPVVLPVLPESQLAFGTGRGYIWEKTIDLIKERAILGYGMDSYVYNFPHNNIDSRAGMQTETIIVDKAHNIYLAVLYGMGIFGGIAFLLLMAFNAITLVKSIFSKNTNNVILILGVAVMAFSVQALFNDSLPGITAVLFVFLGLMFGSQKKKSDNLAK